MWVPYFLSVQNKLNRISCCESFGELFLEFSASQLLKRLVIIDETWIAFAPGKSRQDSGYCHKPGTPREQIPKVHKTAAKTMAIIAMTGDKKFYVETTARNETVDSDRYIKFVENCLLKFSKERSEKRVGQSSLIWQQDNARPHSAIQTQNFFESNIYAFINILRILQTSINLTAR